MNKVDSKATTRLLEEARKAVRLGRLHKAVWCMMDCLWYLLADDKEAQARVAKIGDGFSLVEVAKPGVVQNKWTPRQDRRPVRRGRVTEGPESSKMWRGSGNKRYVVYDKREEE